MFLPRTSGFYFPPEWHPHTATWLTFPHTQASWQGIKLPKMYDNYLQLIKNISVGEKVGLIVNDEKLREKVTQLLQNNNQNMDKIEFLVQKTNDSWCRDHGPAFLINPTTKQKMIVDWEYNAWGGKYPPFFDDNNIPKAIANYRGIEFVSPGIVMEGGSVEFNGAGTILTSKSCLLNKNRNPHLNQEQIEQYLFDFYGAEQVLWVNDGIVGDDTDGHIDDTTRFVNEDTVVTMIESNKNDENHAILNHNLKMLQKMRLLNGKPINVVELPMPEPVIIEDFRVPASYGNFLICNAGVLVPTFKSTKDQIALDILQSVFKEKPVIGLDSTDIIWGQGSFHCLTQQEPAV